MMNPRLSTILRSVAVAGLALTPGVVSAAGVPTASQQAAVMSVALRQQLARMADPAALVPLEIVSTSDPAPFVRSVGGRVDADIGGRLVAARVPADRVADLARLPGVVDLLASQRLQPTLDLSVPDIGANRAWSLRDRSGVALRGKGVLVGIVDSGIDYRNGDFKNPNGSTRIKYIWDQTQRGNPPDGSDIGYECDASSIDSGSCPERDVEGHGTHVAGIAAGNGRSSNPAREIGVAPEADLIVVKTTATSEAVIAAWQYLIDKARQLREPIVINNSFGSQTGPHDGSEAESRAIDALSGPGRIFVAAAGNEGNQGIHTSGSVSQGGSATITVHSQAPLYDLPVSVFYSSSDELTATVAGPDGSEVFGPIAFNRVLQRQYSADRATRVTVDARPWDATHHSILVDIERNPAAPPLAGDWTLTLTGTQVTGGGRFNAWLTQGTNGLQTFASPDESDTIASPADARSVIAVGAYVTRATWTDSRGAQHSICDFMTCSGGSLPAGAIEPHSSTGPTADGRQKPDIVAPGALIDSSRSGDAAVCPAPRGASCIEPDLIAVGGKNLFEMGTSMSAPHVAGTIALMLQANGSLDPAVVGSMLRTTARHDGFTGTGGWSPRFGAGKVNAYAAVQRAQSAAGPASTPTARPAMSFTLQSLRVETSAGAPTQAVAGRSVALAAHVQVKNATVGVPVTRQWTVTRGGTTVGRHAVTGALPNGGTRSYRWTWSFKPVTAGSYALTIRIIASGQTRQKSISFSVRRS